MTTDQGRIELNKDDDASAVLTEQTRRAFDAAASVYDATYEHLYGIRRLRRLTHALFTQYYSRGDSLLELNCGTGSDAIALAQEGMRVLATDLSPGMVAEAQNKITGLGLGRLVEARRLSFQELGALRGTRFDGVYSNLGGINCTPDLSGLAADLSQLVRVRGVLIAVVMPPLCLWETVAFAARGQWRQAFRRLHAGGCAAHLHGGIVQTFYHSPNRFLRAFLRHFEPVELMGLNIFTPPPNAVNFQALLGRGARLLERLDEAVAHTAPFSLVGDHFAIVMRRRAG